MKKRTRRTAEEARELILDAAERRLAEGGPARLRLQEIAADVGVSHPTILHHFGSREALVEAVVDRALEGLRHQVVTALTSRTFEGADAAALLALVLRALAGRGQARLLAWLALEGHPQRDPARLLRGIAEVMHARRVAVTGREASFEDTLFVVVLGALAMLGEAIMGPATWESARLAGDARAPDRFHAWLVNVLTEHLLPARHARRKR